ncbi:hypothetical protein PC120_g14482 [Phytophthora cactorum]|nr:hypothetical protein PC120_g14482 [Phytophthora cactorum]
MTALRSVDVTECDALSCTSNGALEEAEDAHKKPAHKGEQLL